MSVRYALACRVSAKRLIKAILRQIETNNPLLHKRQAEAYRTLYSSIGIIPRRRANRIKSACV